MPKYPKISIVTVTLNSESYLGETICSVINSGYPNLEYIGIDGGSTDDTLTIWARYSHKISSFSSEPDDGISDAFNKGIRRATGEIIGIVSADDALLPGALQAVAECYKINTKPDVIHGNVIFLDELTRVRSVGKPISSLRSFWFGQPLKHGATFVTRDAYEHFGLFDLQYRCAMDYDLTLRFWRKGARFIYLPRELALIRTGGINMRWRARTRTESRLISIRNGCSPWKAWGFWGWKVLKDFCKRGLGILGFHGVLSFYRRFRGINVVLSDDN